MKKLILALFLLGCDSQGLQLEMPDSGSVDTVSSDTGKNTADTKSSNDTLCSVIPIGQIHSWNALILAPQGVVEGMTVYLDGAKLDPDDWYAVMDGPNVSPHGDYIYIIKRTKGDHDVAVSYGCPMMDR